MKLNSITDILKCKEIAVISRLEQLVEENRSCKKEIEKLKKEMDTLWREERPEVTKKVTWAASLGDRSENADTNTIKSACVKSTAGCAT